jgi:hypothetical protein
MMERVGRLRLDPEPAHAVVVFGEVAAEDLDRDVAFEAGVTDARQRVGLASISRLTPAQRRWHRRLTRSERDAKMRVEDVPLALHRQLGPEATDGLLGTLELAGREWKEDAMTRLVDRFESRLTIEISGLRAELREGLADQRADLREALAIQRSELREVILNQGIELRGALATQRSELREALAAQGAELRGALTAQGAELREALATQGAELRGALADQGAALRSEIAGSRADLIRWSFLFWTGQIVAIAVLLNALL